MVVLVGALDPVYAVSIRPILYHCLAKVLSCGTAGDDAAKGDPVAIRILNDLMLFSCLVALATRVL